MAAECLALWGGDASCCCVTNGPWLILQGLLSAHIPQDENVAPKVISTAFLWAGPDLLYQVVALEHASLCCAYEIAAPTIVCQHAAETWS